MVIPQRTCIGCRQVKAKRDLVRIVKSSSGKAIKLDLHGNEKGRGAYICPKIDCINKSMESERLNKAFNIVSDSADIFNLESIEELKQDLLRLIESRHY